MNKIHLLLVGIILLASCSGTKRLASKSNITDVFLLQNGQTMKVQENDQKTIAKAPFSLRFYGKRYTDDDFKAILVAAISDATTFDKVSVGMHQNEFANFGPATGLAGTPLGYDALFINDYGHHYLFYKNEQEHRLELLKKDGVNMFFEFHIPKFFIDDTFYDIADTPISTLYLVIFNDRNGDEIMDAGELTKLKLHLE